MGGFETHSGTGSAHVFERGPTGWSQVAGFRSPESGFPDGFGYSVSLSGNTALVGAVDGDGLVTDSGTAFAFPVPDFAVAYCFCNSGAPCVNAHGGGGCANSTGVGALMSACGSGSITLSKLRFICKADELAFSGTEKI